MDYELHFRTVFVSLLIIAGCGPATDRALARDDAVVIAYCCGDEVLSPAHDMDAKLLVFETLLRRDERGELEGRLARSWDVSPDYREWTYHLPTDVRWHDGVPFTAHDIAFTIELMESYTDPDYGAGAFESATVHDDSTITIRSGFTRQTYQVWMAFYPEHVLAGEDAARIEEWEFWRQPTGNGPYRFVRLAPETSMHFEANPDHFRGHPRINQVVLKFSVDAAVQELLSGAIDVASVPLHDLDAVRDDPRFEIHGRPELAFWAVYWNSARSPLEDRLVRRALTLGIDRRELQRVLALPRNTPIVDGPFTPDQLYAGDLPRPIPYDPDSARALLDAAGWRDDDGDGVRERDGVDLRFELITRTTSSESMPTTTNAAVFVQAQLRTLGVAVEVAPLNPGIVRARLDAGDFDAAISWLRPYEASWLQLRGFGEGPPLGYRNPRMVQLIESAFDTWNPAREASIYDELYTIFQSDVPVTGLYHMYATSVNHRRLRGVESPWRFDPVTTMEALWLEPSDTR